MSTKRTNSGRHLNELWKVGAAHSLYHHKGKWYHLLTRFPGALFDPSGYVLFETEKAFLSCSQLSITLEVHVPNGINQMPHYVRVA